MPAFDPKRTLAVPPFRCLCQTYLAMFSERKPSIRIWVATIVALAVLLASGPSFAEKRIALVIGNGAYPNVGALKNPPNDAKLMANTLRSLGFDVIERIDVNQKGMKKAIKAFGNKLEAGGKDAVGLFYYAGHGVQVGGENYMVPVNVDIQDEADVDIETVSATAVQGNMSFAGNRLNIIIMDSCRNNPFKRSFRSATRGLARMDATKGTLIAYATSPGDVAADGKGVNSPYTEALSQALLTPGLTVERVFKKVRNSVVASTNSNQVPWEASSLTGADFYFKGGAETVAPATSEASPEVAFWNSIQDSENPAEFETFIKAYPNSPFSALAQTRIEALEQKKQAALTPQPAPVQPVQTPSTGTEQVEIAFWNSIKDSGDPESFKAYMNQFPNGQFHSLATMRLNGILEKLNTQQDTEAQTRNLRENYKILNGTWCGPKGNHVWSSASSANITYDNEYLDGIVGDLTFNGNEFSVKMSYSFTTYTYYYRMENIDTVKHYRTDGGVQNYVYKRCGDGEGLFDVGAAKSKSKQPENQFETKN